MPSRGETSQTGLIMKIEPNEDRKTFQIAYNAIATETSDCTQFAHP